MPRGLSDIKTLQMARIRSKPGLKGSDHLRLFVLSKHRERLESYRATLAKSSNATDRVLKETDEEMAVLGKKVLADAKGARAKRRRAAPVKQFKRMKLDY